MAKSKNRKKRLHKTTKNTCKKTKHKLNDIILTTKDVFGNTFRYYYNGLMTNDEQEFIENIKKGTWTTILISPTKTNVYYFAELLSIISEFEKIGIHEHSKACVLFVGSKLNKQELIKVKNTIISFASDNKIITSNDTKQ